MVQILTKSIKLDVADVGQLDWNKYGERLKDEIYTAKDRLMKQIGIYMVHIQNEKPTVEATIPVVDVRLRESEPRRRIYHI